MHCSVHVCACGYALFCRVTVLDNQTFRKEIQMGNQEPPFEQPGEQPPPEQQPGEERGINYDQRERPRSDFAAPQTPPGYPPPQGYPRPPQGYPPPQQRYPPPQGYPLPQQGYYAGPVQRRRRSPW